MHWACRRGYLDIVSLLLNFGFSWKAIDMVGRTPLQIAEKGKYQEIVNRIQKLRVSARRGAQELYNINFIKNRARQYRIATRKLTKEREAKELAN